ncbi:MocR-like pyridoxine biosynthesis transcription factor PdxR [Undibacterium terreum]|uniref:GntR family transcriptional regulator n=1 Tax=Undibacterium terreum TaxID=1224302 RepID=A0A916UZ88_9BURK|nr:PLP-dependent aminotransferase family protein [Undibacterium terreum]GGC96059.1 GntR family transcriptional regulator [Undibacterium terreum]
MEPIFELALELPDRDSRNLLRSLHGQLRAAILDGRLQPGLRLPSTRVLASTCRVSRNTAVAAYDLLLGEGYLEARPGAGTYVAQLLPRHTELRRQGNASLPQADEHRLNAYWRKPPAVVQARGGSIPAYDFQLGSPDQRHFAFDIWRRLAARSLHQLSKSVASYEGPEGRQGLREAIAAHVSLTRAVACSPQDILVTSGAQQAFDLLARILVTPGKTLVAVEDPGYPPLRATLAAAGAKLVPVAVDAEGLIVEQLPKNAAIICVTPSHQFPLGVAMSARRRAALLEHAQKYGAVIIEDDYDSEFRFGGRPLDALQTLDRADAVFYVGTFSKSLFPGLRLGFVVAPVWAQAALAAARQCSDWHGNLVAQDTLAAFISGGHLARHVRKMRQVYDRRRRLVLDALQADFPGRLQALPSAAGLHLAALAHEGNDLQAIRQQAAAHGVSINTLGQYFIGRQPKQAGLVFGYGAIDEAAIPTAMAILRRLMQSVS